MRHATAAAISLLLLACPAHAQVTPPPAAPAPSGWVVLPVSDYAKLRELAYPPERPPEPPPVAATISRLEYDLAVDGETANGQARLTVDVFKDGWISVPIPAGLRVRDAKIDNRPVTLVETPDGRGPSSPSVLLSRAGRAVVALDLAVPIVSRAGIDSITLPPSPSPVQRVSLSVKSTDLTLTVTGGLIAERTAVAPATRFLVCGRPNAPLGLSWGRRRENPAASQALRVRGSITEIVGLGEDSAQLTAQVALEVVQGVAEGVTLKLPPAFVVSQVSGALVADWDVKGADLVVSFLEPVDRTAGITLAGESRTAREGKIDVPILRIANAEREAGGVATEVLGAGEIKGLSPRGLDAADASDLGPMVAARQSPALVAFRSQPQRWDAPRSLEVTVARYTPQAVLLANIDEARYTALLTEDGKALVEAAYAVRNSQRSFVAVTLPAGATLWSASVDNRPVRPGRATDGALLLPILKDRGRSNVTSAVRVFYVDRTAVWASEGLAAVRLPSVDLPVSRTGLQVYHSPRYRLKLEPGPFRVEPFAEALNAALRNEQYRSAGGGGGGGGRGRGAEGGAEGGIAGGVAGGIVGGLPEAPPPPPNAAPVRVGGAIRAGAADAAVRSAEQEARDLVSQYQRANRVGAIAGLLPIDLTFPSFGPSLYAAAELTPEGKAPEARFTFKREVK